MIRIYGKSIMHLSERIVVDESHICSNIGKCFENEKSNLAFARISGNFKIFFYKHKETILIYILFY